MQLPNDTVGIEQYKALYAHPHARLRSKQNTVGLSDLFWYFLCPGPDIHQEHVESGTALYNAVAETTKVLLNVPTERLEVSGATLPHDLCGMYSIDKPWSRFVQKLATKHALARFQPGVGPLGVGCEPWGVVRLRDFFFPMMARFFYEIVFDEACPDEAVALIVASGQNVVNSIKCTELRDMAARNRLTAYIMRKLEGGALASVCREHNSQLSLEEQALYVQGVFFHTGCVQMSEAMAHTCLAVASHPKEQQKLLDDDKDGTYMDLFITEVLRVRALPVVTLGSRCIPLAAIQ